MDNAQKYIFIIKQQMKEPLLKNSFQIDISSANEYQFQIKFKKRRYCKLFDLMKQTCLDILTQSFLEKYKKQLSKTVFQIQIKTNDNQWTVFKRIQDFIQFEIDIRKKYAKKIVSIPIRKQSQNERPDLLLDFFQVFLTTISKIQNIQQQINYLLFLQIPIIVSRRKLKIYKQSFMKKRSGGRHNQVGCKRCTNCFTNWKKRFFTITSEGIFYCKGCNQQNSGIKQMIPFSFHFSLQYGLGQTGQKFGIIIDSFQRVLHLKAQNIFQFITFLYGLKIALKSNKHLQDHRFSSFSQIRQKCDSKYYIDSQAYFKDLYYSLKSAKKQVFITGWMLTPFFLLIRPADLQSQYRLDKVLQFIAKNGIKVHIIIYLQPKMALNNDSEYTKTYLQSLSPNIKVMRHPNYLLIPFLWSHHEKLVIIDQKIGFLGGLDICYGRMDNNKHKLSDLQGQLHYWQGADYCNHRQRDIITPRQYYNCMINRESTPRMPWHDIAIQIRGDSVIDLTRHFVQYWNFVNYQQKLTNRQLLLAVGINKQQGSIQLNPNSPELKYKLQNKKENINRLREDLRKFESYEQKPMDQSFKNSNSSSKYKSQILNMKNQLKNQERTYSFSRIDNQFLDLQQIVIKSDKQKEFYQNFLKKDEDLQPKSNLFSKIHIDIQKLNFLNPMKYINSAPQIPFRNQSTPIVFGKHINRKGGIQKHQILRSASTWGLGIQQGNHQQSIYIAYIQLISKAKQFIYIQNQFFISVQNKVMDAIRIKIQHAYQNKQKFKVIIIVPLMPAFEGQIEDDSSAVLRVQMHLQYQTICRGGHSLFQKLSHIPDIDQYIQIYCLRTHGRIKNQPVTQMIYVHSKLMIIDDEIVLIGSANINDRSLLGVRDSEIAIVVEDEQTIEIKRQQKIVYLKKLAHRMRVQLYMQHFGLRQNEGLDYLNQDIWWKIKQRARTNTLLYRDIFACYPDDEITTFNELIQFRKKRCLQKYELMEQLIKGNVVQFPRNFLMKQNLKLKASQKQYYVPQINFT